MSNRHVEKQSTIHKKFYQMTTYNQSKQNLRSKGSINCHTKDTINVFIVSFVEDRKMKKYPKNKTIPLNPLR